MEEKCGFVETIIVWLVFCIVSNVIGFYTAWGWFKLINIFVPDMVVAVLLKVAVVTSPFAWLVYEIKTAPYIGHVTHK